MSHPIFTDVERAEVGACFRLLATALRFSPEEADAAPFLGLVRDRLLGTVWPCGDADEIAAINATMATDLDMGGLHEAYQRLFIGPDALEAPPWGSVYLDKESVLFGDSTLELRAFLTRAGVALNTGMNEPEDHIGLVLWLVADILMVGDNKALAELLTDHVLPWSGRYLELLGTHAGHAYYGGLAALIALTLKDMAEKMALKPAVKTLYR